jgi:hypothetical protein
MNWISALWAKHGTKLLGFGGIVLGSISLIDHETMDIIGHTFGPVWGPRVTHGLAIFGGLATAYRGFANSQPK